MQYYPKYQAEGSKLERLVINDSQIKFEGGLDNYKKVRNLSYIDFSFNNIEYIPNEFKLLINLK